MVNRASGGQGHRDLSHLHSHFAVGHCCLSSLEGCLRHRSARAPGHQGTLGPPCPPQLHPGPWETATHQTVQGPALALAVHRSLGEGTEGGSTESPGALTWCLSLPHLGLVSRLTLRVPSSNGLFKPHPFLPNPSCPCPTPSLQGSGCALAQDPAPHSQP